MLEGLLANRTRCRGYGLFALRTLDQGARPLKLPRIVIEQVAGEDVGIQGDHDLLASSRALSMRPMVVFCCASLIGWRPGR